ncbi:PTS sugar transporter subunit IIA [Aeribacillus pallidus]|jgi:sugar PTS system EIIA component|uniref:PTS sugar transporter subunit IIA n=1 Tax=Aeribacillus pallidus TaxID=33936 RepID=UPI003D1CB6D9
MFKNLFKKNKTVSFVAPMTGKVIPLEEVPDPVFSQKMMGDGLAMDPTEGVVYAPVNGEIVQLFPTKHAIGIKTKNGLEVLIHIGIDTVSMNGEGFTAHIQTGDKVKQGDPLISFDLDLVKEKAKSTITPMIITNGDVVESLEKKDVTEANAKEQELMTVKVK